jgi:Galactose oxidase, central domain
MSRLTGSKRQNTGEGAMKSRTKLAIAAVFSLASTFGLAQPAGTFTATGNMTTPRIGHSATLLPNGKVLIAGGDALCDFASGAGCIAAPFAEIYDPVTGVFTATGGMTTIFPRGGVLLPDGRVLFAGSSFNYTGSPATLEFYDPSTGNFNMAGSLATLTGVKSATLLNDGRVLLVGTIGIQPAVPSAELYDPNAETFTPVANWPQGYLGPPELKLPDGRVLLQYPDDYAELFNPTAGTFSVTDGLAPFAVQPQATLLRNGKILFTGGSADKSFPADVNLASLFDPATGLFGGTGMMQVGRDGHTATLLPDGTVLVAGGSQNENIAFPAISSAELYDPTAGRFSTTANMTTARAGHTATLLNNGQVLITGGSAFGSSSSIGAVSGAELYTPAVLIPAPVLFSLSGDGRGQGAVWHATTGVIASPDSPAVAGETLSLYTTSLSDGGAVPPQVTVGGRLAQILFLGDAPGYLGYSQVNFQVPGGVRPGAAVSVQLTYIGRTSNEITIGLQ